MNTFQAAILGIIQGLTEFLPVSSSGHLAVGQRILAIFDAALPPADAPPMIAFDLAVHLATLLPIVFVFRKDLRVFLARLLQREPFAWKFALAGVVATAATGLIAFPLKDLIKQQFDAPLIIAACWCTTGVLLFLSERSHRNKTGPKELTLTIGLAIGIAQAAATLPGISRSGTTIAVALLFGLRHRRAAQFSFLLAFPAILAGAASEFKDLLDAGYVVETASLTVGFITAAGVGWLALIWLLAALRNAKLHYFSYYVWALALLVTVLTLSKTI